MHSEPIPTLVNRTAGSASRIRSALDGDPRFRVHDVLPGELRAAVEAERARGAARIAVCGGDGSVAAAAAALVNTGIELAILPGGTLNHFARDHGIPLAPAAAIEVAAGPALYSVDVGFVNDRLFLNTSSVGAYVSFVRQRERLERWLGYRSASFLAGLRILAGFSTYALALETEGALLHYEAPLVFVGVGERALALPSLGRRGEAGRRGLHVIAVRGRARARLMALALGAMAAGAKRASRSFHMDSFVLDRFVIELPRSHARVALDGEIATLPTPLEYRVARDALTIVGSEERGTRNEE